MCRLMGYLGTPVQLDRLLYKPEHSLIVQSYQPREMTAGLLNADGFGVGWYHADRQTEPFTYKNTLPIWNDINLPSLSRYVESGCVLGSVRSATPGLAIDLSNCQPFQQGQLLALHNGFINRFRQTLYRPMRDRLSDAAYQSIAGSTDSEHIFALLLHELEQQPTLSLTAALCQALTVLAQLAAPEKVSISANMLISDGQQLVASRLGFHTASPTLYWLRDDPLFPDAVLVASEPLFKGNWQTCPPSSLLTVSPDLNVQIVPFS